ncbi:hypothetical protein ABZ345_04360 [Lentzea sp. NPDC005914]|uniref:hypothetical protein n=1 Tax=Lentzea sp. NPDC005914 TaxID=3154572 RepID=UPI0033D31986
MTTPDNPLEDYFRGVDISSAPQHTDGNDLSRQSLTTFAYHAGFGSSLRSRASVRMHGGAVRKNSVAVKRATKILSILQDAITAVAASLRGSKGSRGKFPEVVRQLTELTFTPHTVPGSVIFELVAQDPADVLPGQTDPLIQMADLVDLSAQSFLELANAAAAGIQSGEGDVLAQLRELGPRVARNILKLSAAIIDEDIELDISWNESVGPTHSGKISRATAEGLRNLIKENKIDADIIDLHGTLITVSDVRNIDLRMSTGDVVSMSIEPDLREPLDSLFRTRVVIRAEETIHTIGSGEERRTYRALSITPEREEPEGDEQS